MFIENKKYMSCNLSSQLKIFTISFLALSMVTGIFFTGVVFTTAIDGQNGIGINPTKINPNEKFSKGWFIEKLNSGDEVERSATISNYSDEEKRVILQPEDYISLDGAFSYSDKQDLKGVGSWITLDQTDITIPAQKAVAVKFKLNIPKDIKEGEYAGVIAVQEAFKDSKNQNLKLVSRLGSRIYITIPGKLETGFKFESFKFITSKPEYTDPALYKEYLSVAYASPPDSIFMTLKFNNIGNIFSKMTGNIEISTPTKGLVSTSFNRDYGSFDPSVNIKFFQIPNAKWEVGKYKAKFTFENRAVIESNKDDVKNISPTQVVETEFDMTQSMLDQLKADMNKAKLGRDDFKAPQIKTTQDSELKIQESAPIAKNGVDESRKTDTILYVMGGFIIILLIGIIGYLVYKENYKQTKPSSILVSDTEESEFELEKANFKTKESKSVPKVGRAKSTVIEVKPEVESRDLEKVSKSDEKTLKKSKSDKPSKSKKKITL